MDGGLGARGLMALSLAVLFPVLTVMYVWLAKSEERDALAIFRASYRSYMNHVPAFVPKWGPMLRAVTSD